MQVLVDPYSLEASKEVMLLNATLPNAPKTENNEQGLEAIKSEESLGSGAMLLDRWDVKTHKYKNQVEGKINILSSLFSGATKSVVAGIVHEVKRYRLDELETGQKYEVGVAIRLLVATTQFSTDFELSIPNLAAQAQLGMSEARIGISVVGFHGAIGDLLPAPEDLNVENFSTFTNAAREIQARVFGPEGVDFITPTILSYWEGTEDYIEAE